MNRSIVEGRANLLDLAESISRQFDRTVLLLPGWDGNGEIRPAGSVPSGYSCKDLQGRVREHGVTAFHPLAVDAAGVLALSFAGPSAQTTEMVGGTGSHTEYDEHGEISIDLMSSNPDGLVGRVGEVHVVDSEGWEPFDTDNVPEGRPPLVYAYKGTGAVAILGTGLLTLADLPPVRYHPDPSMAHYAGPVSA
jgi:hypothetical protein